MQHASIDPSVGIAAVEEQDARAGGDDSFGQEHDSRAGSGNGFEQEHGGTDSSTHFCFVPRPHPLQFRPGSDDLGARLAILRCATIFCQAPQVSLRSCFAMDASC